MARFLIMLFAAIFAAQVLSGCGPRQEAKKPLVIKPMDVAPENTEEEDMEEEGSPAPESAKTVTESAIDKASAIQKAQEQYSTVEVSSVVGSDVATLSSEPSKAKTPSEILVVADFDSGEKPNNLGGNFGAWNKDPSDPTQWCKESFDNVARRSDKGFSMKLDYSVDSPNPAYNGFWMMLPNTDISKYDTLSLWVKGDPRGGYSTVFKIELKNANKQVGRYYISNVTDSWQKVSIPLSEFKGLIDKTNITEFVVVFEDRMATNKKGVIYIDDITFTKK